MEVKMEPVISNSTSKEKSGSKTFDAWFWRSVGIYAIVILLVCSLPILLTRATSLGIDFTKTGSIGDTIGGTMGPFVAIAASVLTFFAFWVQYKANIQQRAQFQEQINLQKEHFDEQLRHQKVDSEDDKNDWKIERFESKYFDLIKMHRANVEEMAIGGVISGRKSFVSMFYEFRFTYQVVENSFSRVYPGPLSQEVRLRLCDITYRIFFYGIGENSSEILKDIIPEADRSHLSKTIATLRAIQIDYGNERRSTSNLSNFKYQHIVKDSNGTPVTLKVRYSPFDGHSTKLGHYFRHLYQTVDFVAKSQLFNKPEKYLYLRTLRAQLSNHEQLLLYYNILSAFGRKWIKNNYITDFKLIRNIPLPAANFGLTPEEKFESEIEQIRSKGEELFEWDDIKNSQ